MGATPAVGRVYYFPALFPRRGCRCCLSSEEPHKRLGATSTVALAACLPIFFPRRGCQCRRTRQAASSSLSTGNSSDTEKGSSAAAAAAAAAVAAAAAGAGAADRDIDSSLPPNLRSRGQVATDSEIGRPGGTSNVSGSSGVSQPRAAEASSPGSEVRLMSATIG